MKPDKNSILPSLFAKGFLTLLLVLLCGGIYAAELKFWTTEEQPERMQRQQEMAKLFKEKTGISVQVIPVTESELGKRTTAAFAANDLPDVIYHTLQYAVPWAEAGILDVDAATEAVNALGQGTFAPGALNAAKFSGGFASVPVDGWTQMIVYRKDLFEANGLRPPDSYKNIEAAIKKLHNPDKMYGFVTATKVDENYMMQVLEHVMLANGYSVVDAKGAINDSKRDRQKLKNALEFYLATAKASPPGELFWKQSRELYFAGKAAMIVWSPFIMDELAGLRDDAPPTINNDPTSRELALKTGFITTLSGPQNRKGAAWADLRFFGITTNAQTAEAVKFVEFSMDEGYEYTLSIAPEGKFPIRRGTASEPDKFIKAWGKLPVGVNRKAPLRDIYPKSVIDNIVGGLDTAQRWGLNENQLSRASRVINSQVFSRVVREYIDGRITVDAAIDKIFSEIKKID